jgi:hypothetical protein
MMLAGDLHSQDCLALSTPQEVTHAVAWLQLTLATLTWPPMISSLSPRGVTDHPAAAGGPAGASRALPSWSAASAGACCSAGTGADHCSLFRL